MYTQCELLLRFLGGFAGSVADIIDGNCLSSSLNSKVFKSLKRIPEAF